MACGGDSIWFHGRGGQVSPVLSGFAGRVDPAFGETRVLCRIRVARANRSFVPIAFSGSVPGKKPRALYYAAMKNRFLARGNVSGVQHDMTQAPQSRIDRRSAHSMREILTPRAVNGYGNRGDPESAGGDSNPEFRIRRNPVRTAVPAPRKLFGGRARHPAVAPAPDRPWPKSRRRARRR